MNAAAPEVSAESVTPTSAGEAKVTRSDGEPDAETKANAFCFVRGCPRASRGGLFCDAHVSSVRVLDGGDPEEEW